MRAGFSSKSKAGRGEVDMFVCVCVCFCWALVSPTSVTVMPPRHQLVGSSRQASRRAPLGTRRFWGGVGGGYTSEGRN